MTTELALACTTFNVIGFWVILFWNLQEGVLKELEKSSNVTWYNIMVYYQILAHHLPFEATVVNVICTRIKPNKKHDRWMIALMCPGYMLFNLAGSFTVGSDKGSIYLIEDWKNDAGLTIMVFVSCGVIQGVLYFILAFVIEKCRSKQVYYKQSDKNKAGD